MDAIFQSVIDVMVAHSEWAFWIALLLATAENTAFLSIFVHTTPILIGVGAIASTGQFDFTPVFLGSADAARGAKDLFRRYLGVA